MRPSLATLLSLIVGLFFITAVCVGDENSSSNTTSPEEPWGEVHDDATIPPPFTTDNSSTNPTVPGDGSDLSNQIIQHSTGHGDPSNGRFIVVLNKSKGNKVLKDHVKWLKQNIDGNWTTPNTTKIASNLTSFGRFAWYSGYFDDLTLSHINDSDVVSYVTPDVPFRMYNEIQVNPPSWGLVRISQRTLPLGEKFKFPENAGEGVTIYVVDTGVNINHKDLTNRATFGTAFLGNRSDERDLNGHGTFVAGVISGKTYGVAKSSKIVSVRALQPDGSGRLSTVLQAIDWITKQHNNSTTKKTIVNLSLGAEYNLAANEAIKSAMDLGIHFSIAAGNEGKDACMFSPASVQGALTVGATNKDDTIATYSNTGKCVDIFAPGTSIVSIWNSSKSSTHTLSGTSMSSPHVAGVMAILLSQGNYTPPELVKKVKDMATPFTTANLTNNGTKKGTQYPNLLLYLDVEDQSADVQYTDTSDASIVAAKIVWCLLACWIIKFAGIY